MGCSRTTTHVKTACREDGDHLVELGIDPSSSAISRANAPGLRSGSR